MAKKKRIRCRIRRSLRRGFDMNEKHKSLLNGYLDTIRTLCHIQQDTLNEATAAKIPSTIAGLALCMQSDIDRIVTGDDMAPVGIPLEDRDAIRKARGCAKTDYCVECKHACLCNLTLYARKDKP